MALRPVGVFDSGMGGVSVLRRIVHSLPNESFIYYGDNGNAPYGNRSADQIHDLTLRSVQELLKHDIKALLIACNTATAAAYDFLAKELPIPVIGTEPIILRAEEMLSGGAALMMATEATVRLPRYRRLREKLTSPKRVIDVPCPTSIVKKIERGELSGFRDILMDTLSPYAGFIIDVIVLGCTHYPLIKREIAAVADELFPARAIICDGSEDIARALENALLERGILEDENAQSNISFMTSGDKAELQIIFNKLFNAPV